MRTINMRAGNDNTRRWDAMKTSAVLLAQVFFVGLCVGALIAGVMLPIEIVMRYFQ